MMHNTGVCRTTSLTSSWASRCSPCCLEHTALCSCQPIGTCCPVEASSYPLVSVTSVTASHKLSQLHPEQCQAAPSGGPALIHTAQACCCVAGTAAGAAGGSPLKVLAGPAGEQGAGQACCASSSMVHSMDGLTGATQQAWQARGPVALAQVSDRLAMPLPSRPGSCRVA